VPWSKHGGPVRTETGLVHKGGGEVVPRHERMTVDTSDSVVRQRIILVLGLEPLQTEQEQVELIAVLRHDAHLQTRRSGAARIALAVGVCSGTANTGDGYGALGGLALGNRCIELVEVGLDLSVATGGMSVVMGAMLERDGELEEGEEGEEGSQETRGLAEIGHGSTLVVLMRSDVKK